MAESKVQKIARGATGKKKTILCACGGEMVWVKFSPGFKKGRMLLICEKGCQPTTSA